jgi:hypothetical protein
MLSQSILKQILLQIHILSLIRILNSRKELIQVIKNLIIKNIMKMTDKDLNVIKTSAKEITKNLKCQSAQFRLSQILIQKKMKSSRWSKRNNVKLKNNKCIISNSLIRKDTSSINNIINSILNSNSHINRNK